MKNRNTKNSSLFSRGYNFIKHVSNGSILHSSSVSLGSIQTDIEKVGFQKPDVTKILIDRALKGKSLSEVVVDFESEEFRKEINKRAFAKNIKQKTSFIIGSIPMFKTLENISVVTALNPAAQIPLSLSLYFGISMPAFVALHIAEHILPPGVPRNAVKYTKIMVGIPFCVMAECVDKVGSASLKVLNLPDTSLNMQGTLGVPSDLKLQDVFNDMKRWGDENSENFERMSEAYESYRNKELGPK